MYVCRQGEEEEERDGKGKGRRDGQSMQWNGRKEDEEAAREMYDECMNE